MSKKFHSLKKAYKSLHGKLRVVGKKLHLVHTTPIARIRVGAKWIKSIPSRASGGIVSVSKKFHALWNSKWCKRLRHVTLSTVLISLTLSTVLVSLFAFYSLSFEEKILIKVYAPGANLSGLTQEQAIRLLESNFTTLHENGIPFQVHGKRYIVPIESLEIEYDLEETVRRAFSIGHSGNFWNDQLARLKAIFVTQNVIDPTGLVSVDGVEQGVRASIPEVSNPAQDAHVVVVDNGFVLVQSQPGTTTDFAGVTKQIAQALESFEPRMISITITEEFPEVLDEEAERSMAVAEELVQQDLVLRYDDNGVENVWSIDLDVDKNWIAFEKDGPVLSPTISTARLRAHLDTVIAPEVNQQRVDATITMPEEGSRFATIEDRPQDGYTLLVEDTLVQVKQDVDNSVFESVLQIAYEPGRVLTSEGEDVGLRDLLSVGRSN